MITQRVEIHWVRRGTNTKSKVRWDYWRIAEQLVTAFRVLLFLNPLFFLWGGGVFDHCFTRLLEIYRWLCDEQVTHQRPIKDTCILSMGVLSFYSKNHLMNILEKAPFFFWGGEGGKGSRVRRVLLIFLRISVPIGSNGILIYIWLIFMVQDKTLSPKKSPIEWTHWPMVHGARKLLKIPDYLIAGSQLRGSVAIRSHAICCCDWGCFPSKNFP